MRFINNIYELAKRQKKKIGDLEKNCDVSTGYLARLRQDEKNVAPSAVFLMKMAEQLSVSMDALFTFDFSNSTGAEQKLLNYMEKLLRDTEARKLIWQRDPAGASGAVPMNPDGSSAHPLFKAKGGLLTPEEMAEAGLPDTVSLSEFVYHSPFRPDRDDLCSPEIYRCAFSRQKVLYLASVVKPGPSVSGPAQWTELELVMSAPELAEPVPFAHTDHDWPGCLDETLARLFDAVRDAAAHPHLSLEASAFIDAYLS